MIAGGLVVFGGLTLPAIFQWLVVCHWLPRASWWIPASAVGKLLSFYPIILAITRFGYPSPYASPLTAIKNRRKSLKSQRLMRNAESRNFRRSRFTSVLASFVAKNYSPTRRQP